MSKFTQGQWEVTGSCIVGIRDIKNQKMPTTICICGFGEISQAHLEELDANTRLIASAPEMYALIRRLLFYEYWNAYRLEDSGETHSGAYLMAKKSIAQIEALLAFIDGKENIYDDNGE